MNSKTKLKSACLLVLAIVVLSGIAQVNEIRNIASNGHVWTGTGNNERNHFPALENLPPS